MIAAIVCTAFTGSFLVFAFYVLKPRYQMRDEEALRKEERNRQIARALDELAANRKKSFNTFSELSDFEPIHYN